MNTRSRLLPNQEAFSSWIHIREMKLDFQSLTRHYIVKPLVRSLQNSCTLT